MTTDTGADRHLQYRWYILALLAAISALSFMDRQLPFVLAESIKADLGLSDGQLGLVGGLGFSIFYTAASLPIARLADRTSRRWVITGCVALWSVMTASGAAVQSFLHLFLMRAGLGIGEAGSIAPAHSLVADYFLPGVRATAMSLLILGSTTGIMLGFALGGWMDAQLGWRMTFFSFGLFGLILAAATAIVLREPERPIPRHEKCRLVPAVRHFLGMASYRNLALAASCHGIAASGITAWMMPLLLRSHDMEPEKSGALVGAITGLAGGANIFLSSIAIDRIAAADHRRQMLLPVAGLLIGLPFYLTGFLAGHLVVAILALTIAALVSTSFGGVVFAMVQELSPPSERTIASALVVLIVGLLGGSLGPPAVGYLSDALRPQVGPVSLAWSLVAVTAGAHVAAAFFFWATSRSITDDVGRRQARNATR